MQKTIADIRGKIADVQHKLKTFAIIRIILLFFLFFAIASIFLSWLGTLYVFSWMLVRGHRGRRESLEIYTTLSNLETIHLATVASLCVVLCWISTLLHLIAAFAFTITILTIANTINRFGKDFSISAHPGTGLLGIRWAATVLVTGMTVVRFIGRRKGKGKAVAGESLEDVRERELRRVKRESEMEEWGKGEGEGRMVSVDLRN